MSELDILRCGNCGAAVPLADAASVACPACKTDVAIPAAHRDAFASERRDAETRGAARALYKQLGAPPLALRVVGVVYYPNASMAKLRASRSLLLKFIGWYYGLFLPVIAPMAMLMVAILAVNFAMRGVGILYHANVMDTLSSSTRDWIQLPPALAAFVGGAVLGVYGRRRAVSRRALAAALAANPPDHEHGASTCRLCGAPLTVAGHDLGVRCTYCSADNLVAVPAAWIAAIHTDARKVAAQIDIAVDEQKREKVRFSRATKWRLGITFGGLGLLFLFAGLMQCNETHEDFDVPPQWSAYAGDPRPLVRRDVVTGDKLADHVSVLSFTGACPAGEQPLPVLDRECKPDGHCTVLLYAALRRGDHVELQIRHAPPMTAIVVERHEGWPWPNTTDGEFGTGTLMRIMVAEPTDITRNGVHVPTPENDDWVTATLTAEWSAWHEFRLLLPVRVPALSACLAIK